MKFKEREREKKAERDGALERIMEKQCGFFVYKSTIKTAQISKQTQCYQNRVEIKLTQYEKHCILMSKHCILTMNISKSKQ